MLRVLNCAKHSGKYPSHKMQPRSNYITYRAHSIYDCLVAYLKTSRLKCTKILILPPVFFLTLCNLLFQYTERSGGIANRMLGKIYISKNNQKVHEANYIMKNFVICSVILTFRNTKRCGMGCACCVKPTQEL